MENCYNVKGRIFNIQRFSIHDGPGIRTIVFLKGCRLRCKWCCNPESQRYDIDVMNENGTPKTVGEDVTVAEVMKQVRRDKPYYSRSGGGLTLSGGEAFCQPQFAAALLTAAQNEGFNTAVETAGFYPFENIEPALPIIDTVLMDIKNMNSAKHEQFTGQPNKLILGNAEQIAQNAKRLIIRVPIIPGFNDTDAEISAISRFAATLHGVTELHLLPYHRLGQDKYTQLGRKYELDGIEPPQNPIMQRLLETARKSGLPCRIGG